MVRFSLSLLLLLACGCRLEFDRDISCGDGYVDPASEEACDPEDPPSFENACRDIDPARTGACDPTTCQLDLRACLPSCGNGVLDPSEECEPGGDTPAGPDVFGSQRSCTTLPATDNAGPYVGGETNRCQSDCHWDRSPCHRCGNARIEGEEVCDTQRVDLVDVDAYCLSNCVRPEDDERPDIVRCAARCADDCMGYVPDAEGLACCIPTGEPIHSNIRCCAFEEKGFCVPGLGGG